MCLFVTPDEITGVRIVSRQKTENVIKNVKEISPSQGEFLENDKFGKGKDLNSNAI